MDNYGMKVQATVDLPSTKKVDERIRALEKSISKLKVSGQFDDAALKNLTNQLNSLKVNIGSASFSPAALNQLTSQVEKALSNINISGSNIGKQITQNIAENIDAGVINQINKVSNSSTSTILQNEKKKQEAYKATSDAVVYHAGVISKLNKAETNGRFYGSNRGTGYFGTGHYFVDSNTKHELDNNSSYSKLPYTSVDISKYDNLFKATTDEIASKLHSFLENLTKFTQGSDRFNIDELFTQFKNVFTDTTMDIKDFGDKVEQLKSFMSNSNLSDRSDSVSTQFMKSLGYGGVDTRGTKYADTRYGTVIYDLKEESILQANITDELQKQGQMLEKINYEKGQVFDSSADAKIQEQINVQNRLAEVQSEFKRSFDTSNLDKTDSELTSARNRLSEINDIIFNCQHSIENATAESQEFAREMKSLGLNMTDRDIEEHARKSAVSYQKRIEELSLERAELEKRIPVLEGNYNKESQLASEAYKQAQQIVEQRRLEAQQSSTTANEVIQNEEKKQQAIQNTDNTYKSFSELKIGTGNIDAVFDKDGVLDIEQSLKSIRDTYSEFGKVKITNKLFDPDGSLKQFRVEIQQTNGDLKESRNFMMALSEDGKSFCFPEDAIRGAESFVHHLNDGKKASNDVLTEEQKLANIMGDVREKTELARQAEEQRQQTAQNKVINKSLEDEYKQRQKLADKVHEIQLSMEGKNTKSKNYDYQIDTEIKKLKDLGFTDEEVAQKVKILTDAQIELKHVMDSNDFDSVASKNKAIIESDKERTIALNQVRTAYGQLKNDTSQYYNLSKQTKLSTDIQNWLSKNSRASKEAKESLNAYYRELSNGRVSVDRLNYIEKELKDIDAVQRGLGKLGKNLKDQFKEAGASFTQWLSVSSGIMALVYQLQKIPKEVIAVNKAMVELIKVSDASSSNITKYFDEAADSAKRYGSTVSDMINATADWSRLGYNLPDAKKLAEVATLYTNVGDGIDMSTANESLISTLQGFKMTADEAIHVIDAFNEVANTEAINSAGIGEALQRSASSMYAAGNTLEETIGLVTAANAVVQDPDSIGTAYKTISMRIRGAKTEMEELGLETDGMVESTATLQEEIMALSGVDIMKDKDTFKSTYQILDELAAKWQYLTDIQQASITELIAGKRQGNIVSALMSNFDTARRATETAVNSTGSALKEQEEYEKGIEYSLKRLEASFQEFANHILDSSFIKGIVDFGNSAINVIDKITSKLGSLGTIGLGAGLFAGVKNSGVRKCVLFICFLF